MSKKAYVLLDHAPNPDIEGGYWEPVTDVKTPLRSPIKSLKDASNQCLEFIRRNGLGAGNWTGGNVIVSAIQIAYISYNGRIWEQKGIEITEGINNEF